MNPIPFERVPSLRGWDRCFPRYQITVGDRSDDVTIEGVFWLRVSCHHRATGKLLSWREFGVADHEARFDRSAIVDRVVLEAHLLYERQCVLDGHYKQPFRIGTRNARRLAVDGRTPAGFGNHFKR